MAFFHDFRRIKSRAGLVQAIGIHESLFTAILAFEPPPASPRSSMSGEPASDGNGQSEVVKEITFPAFWRHDIPKKNGARGFRTVWEPVLAKSEYKALARRLTSFFRHALNPFPHDSAFGFRPGKNIRENAGVHAGHRDLLCMDIRDFFESISQDRVKALFAGLDIEPDIADLLARFVTIDGKLAPGLPTSPVISNAVAYPIDVDLKALAENAGAVYSRYADDMSFSGDGALPDLDDVRRILAAGGFTVADDKTRRSKIGQAHFVTGLSVSDPKQPHVPREMKRRLRQELYYSRKFGALDHFRRLGTNDDLVMQEQFNRLDGMVKFVAHHEPERSARLRSEWTAISKQSGMRRSFRPKGQDRSPFHIFIDEAELTKGDDAILALAFCVTQHGPQMMVESGEVLGVALDDLWADGDRNALEKRGLHFADATEDLRLAYVTRLATMPFEGYVAMARVGEPSAYESTYLRLLDSMLERRLMAAESQFAFFVFEKNNKVPEQKVKTTVLAAQARLQARNDRRPRGVGGEFVAKPDLRISAPDFLLGVLGRYLRSKPAALGAPEPRDRLMFERLRDKYRLILDVDAGMEFSRRRPIEPWASA